MSIISPTNHRAINQSYTLLLMIAHNTIWYEVTLITYFSISCIVPCILVPSIIQVYSVPFSIEVIVNVLHCKNEFVI